MQNWGRHDYGKALKAWPRDERGEPIEPALLAHCGPLDMEAEMLQTMLESFGIPSLRRLPGDGAFGELILGMSGSGVDIYVPCTRLDEAQELMKGEPDDDGLSEGI